MSRSRYRVRNLTKERKLLATRLERDPGQSRDQWIALNLTDHWNKVKRIFPCVENTIRDRRDSMHIGEYQFLWRDSKRYRTPTSLSAAKYINLCLRHCRRLIMNPDIFVEEDPFPRKFKRVARDVAKKIFRSYGYMLTQEDTWQELRIFKMADICKNAFTYFMEFVFDCHMMKSADIVPMNEWILENMETKWHRKLRIEETEDEASAAATAAAPTPGGDDEEDDLPTGHQTGTMVVSEDDRARIFEEYRARLEGETRARMARQDRTSEMIASVKTLVDQKRALLESITGNIAALTKLNVELKTEATAHMKTMQEMRVEAGVGDEEQVEGIESNVQRQFLELDKQEIQVQILLEVLTKRQFEIVHENLENFSTMLQGD